MHADVPRKLWYAHSRHGWCDHLYGTKGTWKNYSTCFALLDVGFMTILRRTDCFILIWACIAVLADHCNCQFQNCPSSQTKLLRSLAFAAMLFFETMPLWSCMVGLIQLPNFYEGDLLSRLSGLWTRWVSGVEGVQGFCEVHGFKDLMNRRSQQFQRS